MSVLDNSYPKIGLAGATVLITGAGQGIGRATADEFAARGAKVVVTDVDGTAAARAAAEIDSVVGRPDSGAAGYELDVRSRHAWNRVVAAVGRIDILVNNAGVMPLGSFLDEPDEVSAATMDINVGGLINGMRAVVPQMMERRRGHVVNIASLAGKVPLPGMAVYNASKFAAVGLSAAARLEFAERGVSVSTVLPSAVRTSLVDGVELGHGLPTVDPEDVAKAVVGTCGHRRAETSVPGYLSALELGLAVAPERLTNGIRGVFGGKRALDQVDSLARSAYDDRVHMIAVERTGTL